MPNHITWEYTAQNRSCQRRPAHGTTYAARPASIKRQSATIPRTAQLDALQNILISGNCHRRRRRRRRRRCRRRRRRCRRRKVANRRHRDVRFGVWVWVWVGVNTGQCYWLVLTEVGVGSRGSPIEMFGILWLITIFDIIWSGNVLLGVHTWDEGEGGGGGGNSSSPSRNH